MRIAFLAALLLSGLVAGTDAVADEPGGTTIPSAIFSGALSFEGLTEQGPVRGEDPPDSGFTVDLYKKDLGPLGVAIGTGVSREGEAPAVENYMVGLRLDYGGLSVGSALRGGGGEVCGLSNDLCGDGPAWNIGASYSAGAASLSAQYHAVNPTGADGLGTGGVYRLGLDYQIFDGFSSRAGAYFIDGDNRLSEGDSTVVLIGTRITF